MIANVRTIKILGKFIVKNKILKVYKNTQIDKKFKQRMKYVNFKFIAIYIFLDTHLF